MTPDPPSLPTTPVDDTAATLSVRSLFDPDRAKTPERGNEPVISVSVFAESESPAAPPGSPGIVLDDPGHRAPGAPAFVLTKVVGHGGHGEVHEAIQTSLGRPVAVKRIREEVYRSRTPGSHEVLLIESDFRQEALLTGVLEHPNIVPVHDFGRDDRGRPLMAMKLLRGKRWDSQIKADREANLPPAAYLHRHIQILRDVAQAVAFAHSRGIVHRDIKPSQVMVGEFGETVLMDWGLAVFVGDTAESFSLAQHSLMQLLPTPDNASNPAGTPAFMAPEQTRRDSRDIGPATDVFLLGACLYYVLTGGAPYTSGTVAAAMDKASRCDFEPPQVRARDREIPTDLAQLCLRAMQRLPADRVPSARAFVEALDAYAADAGKRTRALEILEEVRGELDGTDRGYREYAELVAKLNQAQALWPESDEVTDLLDRVREGFADAALRRGDLKLAEAQSDLIENEERRAGLRSRQQTAQHAVADRARVLVFLEKSATVMAWMVMLAALGIVSREMWAGEPRGSDLAPEGLIADIRYLDEGITMSGLMAVESGEAGWWDRRGALAQQMTETFTRLGESSFGRERRAELMAASEANRSVRDMGRKALESDQSGDRARAREILHSAEYNESKAELAKAIESLALQAQSDHRRRLLLRLVGLLPTYALIILIAAYVLRFRRFRREVPTEEESAKT